MHPFLQQQHTVGKWDEGVEGVEWLGLVRFHDLEKGECRAIVRPKEIQMCGVFPTLETVSEDCVPAGQSEIEPFSGSTWQESLKIGGLRKNISGSVSRRMCAPVDTKWTPTSLIGYSLFMTQAPHSDRDRFDIIDEMINQLEKSFSRDRHLPHADRNCTSVGR